MRTNNQCIDLKTIEREVRTVGINTIVQNLYMPEGERPFVKNGLRLGAQTRAQLSHTSLWVVILYMTRASRKNLELSCQEAKHSMWAMLGIKVAVTFTEQAGSLQPYRQSQYGIGCEIA